VLQPFSEKILGQTDFTLSKQVFHAFQRFLDVLDEVKRKEILCSKLCDEILVSF
jgi:hypothetical protein